MEDYVDRAKDIYTALKESGSVDQSDVAELTIAVLQEEAKDHRTEMIGKQRGGTQTSGKSKSQSSSSSDDDDWRKEPATDAQKKALENLGVDYSPGLTKGAASNLIDKAKSEG